MYVYLFSVCIAYTLYFFFLFTSFSELFSSGQYDAAATCAINSPGEILCNEEALKNLKCKNLVIGSILTGS